MVVAGEAVVKFGVVLLMAVTGSMFVYWGFRARKLATAVILLTGSMDKVCVEIKNEGSCA